MQRNCLRTSPASPQPASAGRNHGTTLPSVSWRDPATDTDYVLGSDEKSIVVALGRAGCSPCQTRELRNLDSLYQEIDASLPVVGVYYNDLHEDDARYRYEAMQIKRLAAVDFPYKSHRI